MNSLRLLAVSVGRVRTVEDPRRGPVRTGIWKEPVSGPVCVGRLNLAGDAQADPHNHGGEHMAVYAYPHEHYAAWATALGRDDLAPGCFGENLTTAGLLEADVRIGERLRIGSALLEVSQPRTPCYKLALRLGDPTVPKQLVASGRCGFYLRVIEEGELEAGAPIERLGAPAEAPSVAEMFRLMHHARDDRAGAVQAASLATLSPAWREEFAARAAREDLR